MRNIQTWLIQRKTHKGVYKFSRINIFWCSLCVSFNFFRIRPWDKNSCTTNLFVSWSWELLLEWKRETGKWWKKKRVYYQTDYHMCTWNFVPLWSSVGNSPQMLGPYPPTPLFEGQSRGSLNFLAYLACCIGGQSEVPQPEGRQRNADKSDQNAQKCNG